MKEEELIYTIAFTLIPNLNLQTKKYLMEQAGNASTIYQYRKDIREIFPEANVRIVEAIADMEKHLDRAEEEKKFADRGKIKCISINDEQYPYRLKDCPDAPVLLYYRGNTDLNCNYILSIVGTRHITEYGKDLCAQFVSELSKLCPDILIVSGLAYGVDIHAHRNALTHNMRTIGVLAHGLNQIYPRMHRDTAVQMTTNGGLLTEFPSYTNADKRNFVQRNRIVAGISDATLVVESASKGGSLITAGIANDYHKDVFAFPGRVKDAYSEGCNLLIQNSQATLLTDAESFIKSMGWENALLKEKKLKEGIQQEMFPQLGEDEQIIVDTLREHDGLQINVISVQSGIPIGKLSSLLFQMELRGIVKMWAGGMYRLL